MVYHFTEQKLILQLLSNCTACDRVPKQNRDIHVLNFPLCFVQHPCELENYKIINVSKMLYQYQPPSQ